MLTDVSLSWYAQDVYPVGYLVIASYHFDVTQKQAHLTRSP